MKAEREVLPFLFGKSKKNSKNIDIFIFYFDKSMEKRKSLCYNTVTRFYTSLITRFHKIYVKQIIEIGLFR